MPRRAPIPLIALLLASCVSVEPAIDPRGAVRPGQRLVVLAFQSPGPWIRSESDSKAEAAAKILPIGMVVQSVQDERVLTVSKDLQQYMPRPSYAAAVLKSLVDNLRNLHDGPVETAGQAGLPPAMLLDWNRAKDQLDWRNRYYVHDEFSGPPRDYSKALALDDAIVLDVNVSFGTDVEPVENDADRVYPALSASFRAYRGGTTKLLLSREEALTDKTSSKTLTEFRLEPFDLTRRIESLAPALGEAVAQRLAREFQLRPRPAAPGKGLLDLSTIQTSTEAAPAVSSAPAPAQ